MWILIAFGAGLAAGFIGALLRAHPSSPYRDELELQRQGS